jgi:hypothetical protein
MVWNTYVACAVVTCYDKTVLYRGTNSEENPFLFFGQFGIVHLGVADVSLSLEEVLRCWVRTSNLFTAENNCPQIRR